LDDIRILLTNHNRVPRLLTRGWRMSSPDDDIFLASPEWVAPEALRTGADRPVVPHFAQSPLAAGVRLAGVAAVEVETGQQGWALSVVLTVAFSAGHKRISLETSWTSARCCGSSRYALSVRAAGIRITGVVLFTPCDCVRHGDIVGETLTHGVPEPVHLALGVGPARGGKAGVWRGGPSLNLGTSCDGVWGGGEAS